MSLTDLAASIPPRLAELGLTVPRGSRFLRYSDVLSPSDSGTTFKSSADEDWEETKQACIDVPQMAFILDWMPREHNGEWLTRLQRTLDGPTVADPCAQPHLPEQNTQFELYTAARLRKAGSFVRFAEPDIIAVFSGTEIGFACKQLLNIAKLETRVKEAREQILNTKNPGVIALELTLGLNRSRDILGSSYSGTDLNYKMSAFYSAFYDQYRKSMASWTGQTSWIRGVFLIEHLLHLRGEGRYQLVTSSLDFPLVEHHSKRRHEFKLAYDSFLEGGFVSAQSLPRPFDEDRVYAHSLIREARRQKWK